MAFHLWSYVKFTSSVNRWGAEISDRRVLSFLQSLSYDMGIKEQVAVKTCVFISTPMLIGFFRPVILLPEHEIPPSEWEYIFRHELTHYKRKDLWMNLLVLIVSAVHWFNPIVCLMKKEIRADSEAACDEAVVAGSDADKRKHYAEAIIGFAEAKITRRPFLSTYFYGGSNSMKKRLSSVMNTNKKRRGLAAICATAIIMATFLSGTVFSATAASSDKYIGGAKAKSIALKHAGLSKSKATFIKTLLDFEDGCVIYEVEFYGSDTEFDYEIDAMSGEILDYDHEIGYYVIPSGLADTTNADKYISKTKAKSAALKHAGLPKSEVTFIKARLDFEDGRVIYDIEFYSGNTEYDYEIDAMTGKVLEYDKEIEYYTIKADSSYKSASLSTQSTVNTTEYISEAKAKSIALNAAGISESDAGRIKVEFDHENGKAVFEVEFYYGKSEYEYEIDAVSGDILISDIDYDD